MKKIVLLMVVIMAITIFEGCKKKEKLPAEQKELKGIDVEKRLAKYATVRLEADISTLTEKERQMLPLLFEAAKIMDEIYWLQAFGDKNELLNNIKDENLKKLVMINYGPWDRLDNDFTFIEGYNAKPKGANFYPADMTTEEFDKFDNKDKGGLYNLVRRDEGGKLIIVPYHTEYKDLVEKAAKLLDQASVLAEDAGLKEYLSKRAKALLDDNYQESDIAWLKMKTNTIDFVVGPIENYEDGLYEYKTAQEAYILIKDKVWSKKLEHFAQFLPDLQKSLPVPAAYKQVNAGSNSELNAYDVVYYAGDCNSGSKTIAINLPNDPTVQLAYGTRRLQLKNTMKAKFDKILLPLSTTMIDKSQQANVKFDAFFANTMFHEVAHGLGIKYLLNDPKKEVKDALKETYSVLEEAKADILGLYMITYLYNKGELKDLALEDYYITFAASMFRSIRFGGSSSHGKANMMRFNYFLENGVLVRNDDGSYKVDMEKMKKFVNELGAKILIIQGDGNYQAAKDWIEKEAVVSKQLKTDLEALESLGIPTDIIFEQGPEVLGLK